MAGRLNTPARGEIWMYRFGRPDKRRPALILSRPAAIDLLDTVIIAPITTTIHGVPSEVVVDESHGLKHPSAVNLDNIQTVYKSGLYKYVGLLDEETMGLVCRALAIATGCL